MRAIILYFSHSLCVIFGFMLCAILTAGKKGDTRYWKGDEDERN